MSDDSRAIVPVWTLATGETRVPAVALDEAMTPARLTELRGVLAALADQPIATMELYPLPDKLDRSKGIAIDAASPLARNLSQLISQTARGSSVATTATVSGDGLYRMVVPAKVAAEFGQGLVRPMRSATSALGIHSALRDSTGIVAHATFVPVGGAATAGAVGGTVAGATALTVAAPLVLMAVAVGVSAAAEQQRREAIEHITELLEQLHEQNLDDERSELDGCRDAIDKATAILLDEGKLGVSLGLDSAVHAIGKALAATERRLGRWQMALDRLSGDEPVDVDALIESFPGIDEPGGVFSAHLELAALAIALKRRVIVLQAVEHAQTSPGNLLENFVRALKADQQRLEQLEADISSVLVRLSTLELARPQGWCSTVVTYREVDRLMRVAHRIRGLSDGVVANNRAADVTIEIARNTDGSVIVFPALSA